MMVPTGKEHAMSDYMFMLENHLSSDQNQAVGAVQEVAARQNVNVFLAGGAMRDVLGGFQVRDLDFSVEGPAFKFAKAGCRAPRGRDRVDRREPPLGGMVFRGRCDRPDRHVTR